MLKAVELVEDKKNSTDFFYPKSCQVYLGMLDLTEHKVIES